MDVFGLQRKGRFGLESGIYDIIKRSVTIERSAHFLIRIKDSPVFKGEGGFEAFRQGLVLQFFPHIGTDEEEVRVGMVEQMGDIFRREVLQDTDDDAFVGSDGEVSDRPVGAVTARQGYLIAALDTQVLKEQMEARHLRSQFAERIFVVLTVIGEGRVVPLMGHHICQVV